MYSPIFIWLIHEKPLHGLLYVTYMLYESYIYIYIISYHLFADADTGIDPHAASQHHARPKAKCGIVMLSVGKSPYPRMQTMCNEFMPCSKDVCQILKHFRSFKIPDAPLIWPISSHKRSVVQSHCNGKDSGRRSCSPL